MAHMSIEQQSRDRLNNAINKQGVGFVSALLSVALLGDIFIGTFQRDYLWLIIPITVIALLLNLVRYLGLIGVNRSVWVLNAGYHIIFALLLYWIAPYDSPYLFLSSTLIYLTLYSSGTVGWSISLLFVINVHIFSTLTHVDQFMYSDLAHLTTRLVVLTVIAIMIRNILLLAQTEVRNVIETTSSLEVEQQRLRALINSMHESVIATDHTGRILMYNAASLELFNTHETLTNRGIDSIAVFEDDTGQTLQLHILAEHANPRGFSRSDIIMKLPGEDDLNVSVSASPIHIRFDVNSQAGFTFIIRDITKERSLEEKHRQFISIASHELRTPVATMEAQLSNMLVTLEHESSEKDIRLHKKAKETYHQILNLSELINNISVLSQAQSGEIGSTLETINPRDILEHIAEKFLDIATKKQLQLTVEPIGQLHEATFNTQIVEEILKQYTANAIKFTHDGSVQLQCSQSNAYTTFSVVDTGPGISRSDQKKLFDSFYQSEDFQTREVGGTGLGLHTTQVLAKHIGAEIKVESQLNKGSVFRLLVPLKLAE